MPAPPAWSLSWSRSCTPPRTPPRATDPLPAAGRSCSSIRLPTVTGSTSNFAVAGTAQLSPPADPVVPAVTSSSWYFCTACAGARSEEHTSELQSRGHLVCRLLLAKKNTTRRRHQTAPRGAHLLQTVVTP